MSDIPRDRVVRYLKIHSQRGFSDHIHSHGTMDGEAVLYASDILALLDENSELLVKRRRHGEERARAEAAEAEVERLLPWAQLGVAVMEGWPEIGDVDEFMVQEMAVKTGVLREIPGGYDPEQHYDSVGVDPEPGDPWFERIAIPRAALGEECE